MRETMLWVRFEGANRASFVQVRGGRLVPTHVYSSGRRPPTLWDHVRAHPYEIVLSIYAMFGGGMAVISAFNEALKVSPSLDQLPAALAAIIGLLFIFGGGGIFHGLLFEDPEDISISFKRERMGLVLQTGGWIIYGICVLWLAPPSVLSWLLCFCLALANIIRFDATIAHEKGVRAAISRVPGQ